MTTEQEPAPRRSRFGWLSKRLEGRHLVRNVLVLMSGTAVAQLLPILASPIIARLYSPYDLGVYAAFMSLVGLLIAIAAWRYDLAIVRADKPEDARALVKVASRLNATTCVVVGLGLVIAAGPVSEAIGDPGLKPWLAGVGLVAWAYAQVAIFSYWCNRNVDYHLMSANRVVQSVATTGSQLAGGAASLGATGLIGSAFIGQFVALGDMFRRIRTQLYGKPASSLRRVMVENKDMPMISAPTAAMETIRTSGIQLLISASFSAATLGQFSQAWRLLQTPMGLVTSSLSQVFYQKLATTSRGEMSGTVLRTAGHAALIGAVPFALIWLLAPPLFPIIFGEPWGQAGLIAAALTPWLYVNFITSPISFLFVVVRRQGMVFWYGVVYTAAPLWIIWNYHDDILTTVTYLSWAMAALLGFFLCMALWVARGFDREHGEQPPVAPLRDAGAATEAATTPAHDNDDSSSGGAVIAE